MNIKVKVFIFGLLIIAFLSILFYGIFGFSFSFLSEKQIKENRVLNKNLVKLLKINNIDAVYEENEDIYYYSVSDNHENDSFILKLQLDEGFKYKILNAKLNIIKVDYKKVIDVIIYNKSEYCYVKIQLVNLPLISISTKNKITTKKTDSVFKYINSENDMPMIESTSKINIRGASSQSLPKKSYKIEFFDEKYDKEIKLNIPNFYYGSSLVLDAVYNDKSKVRNILSTQIWNEVSDDFTNVDVYGEFVEVFINNKYMGLYVLTEPITRTRLGLEKSSNYGTSAVIKTNGWNVSLDDSEFKDMSDSNYLDYEIKYPNDSDHYEAVWEYFLNNISEYYNPNVKTTDEIIENTFDKNNYIDLIIFNLFLDNIDSCMKKNIYFYLDDINTSKVYIQPWDLEYTYGLFYKSNGDEKYPPDHIRCEFTQVNTPLTNQKLISRYWELRKNVLNFKNINRYLINYETILTKGASLRDSKRWYDYSIEKEIDDIRGWLKGRIKFLDVYVSDLENE